MGRDGRGLGVRHRERFFEVYNGHPGVNHLGDAKRVGIERLWDIANTIRLGVLQAAPLYASGPMTRTTISAIAVRAPVAAG